MALSFIGAGSAGATTITIPSGHALGDLLVMFAFRDGSTTAPTVPTGWTSLGVNTGTTCASVVAYKVCETAAETSGTWTNASMLACHVYRGQRAVTPLINSGGNAGTTSAVDYAGITAMTEPGTSWVIRFAGNTSINTSLETAPSGHTNRTNTASAVAEVSGHDTNGPVSSSSFGSVAAGGTAGNWITKTIELIAAPAALTGMKTAMFGAENTAPSTTVINYNWPAPSHSSTWSATEAQRTTLFNEAITITSFKITVDTAPGTAASGKKYMYTLRANSVNTGITTVITDTETSATWTGSVTLSAYAFIAMMATPVNTPTAPTGLYWQIEYRTAGQYFFMNGGSGLVSASATNYIAASGQNQQVGSATSTDYEIIVPESGIITELSSKVDVALTSSMAYAVSVRINDTTDYLITTLNSTSSGGTAVGSVAVSAGDRIVIKCVPSNTPTTARLTTCLTITPSVNGETFFGYGSAAAPSGASGAVVYEQMQGVGAASWNSTENLRYVMPPAYDYKKFYVKLMTAPGGATSRAFTFRDNGADTALSVTISGASTTGSNTGTTITHSGNLASIKTIAAGGTAATTNGVKMGYVMAMPQDSVTYEDITFDAKSAQGFDATSTTLSHTTSGTNRLLVVAVAVDGASTISSVTYAGVAMTLAKTFYNIRRISLYYLVAPATGANNIAVTLSGSDDAGIMAVSYNGVNQTAPFDDTIASDVNTSPYGQTITTRHEKELIVFASADDDNVAPARTPSGSSTERHDVLLGSGAGDFGGFFSDLIVATPSTNTLSYTDVDIFESTSVIATFRPAAVVSGSTGQMKVYSGSAWVPKPVKVWNGTSWVTKPLKRWNGSAWVITPY